MSDPAPPVIQIVYEAHPEKPLTFRFQVRIDGALPGPQHEGLSLMWDFGDGQHSNRLRPTHTYARAGSYPVSVQLRFPGEDDPGKTGSDKTASKTQSAPPPPATSPLEPRTETLTLDVRLS